MTMAEAKKTAKLAFDGKEIELPMLSPTVGPDVIDIRKLYSQGNVFTYDPGFTSTASTDSTITFIDGEKGELLHRGYQLTSWPKNPTSSKSVICFCMANCRLPIRSKILKTASPTTRCCTSRW